MRFRSRVRVRAVNSAVECFHDMEEVIGSNPILLTMYYWHLKVEHGRGGSYDVYFKTGVNYSRLNIPNEAVRSDDLLDVEVSHVSIIEQITPEKYFENMAA